MENSKNPVVAAVVALVVSLIVVLGFVSVHSSNPAPNPVQVLPGQNSEDLGGASAVIDGSYIFKGGVGRGGNFLSISADGTIGPGQNQSSWTNTTGRTVFIDPGEVAIGWTSGTASSSLLFYVGTSTATTYTDYARPSITRLLVDAAIVSTSTPSINVITATTTSAGAGFVAVPAGGRVIFDIQERYACKTVGVCETATSTNRGISTFFWKLGGVYKP